MFEGCEFEDVCEGLAENAEKFFVWGWCIGADGTDTAVWFEG